MNGPAEAVTRAPGDATNLARMVGFSLASTVVYYTWAIGISGFAISTRGVPAGSALWATVAANLVFMATLPLWGKLSDRYGRRPIFITYSIAFMLL
jgi:MHS family alpha-ketoglutarate permease-like MFS transporter